MDTSTHSKSMDLAHVPPPPRRGALGALAITLGLVAGVVGFAIWNKNNDAGAAGSPSEPEPVAATQPRSGRASTWMPSTPAHLRELLGTAKRAVECLPGDFRLQEEFVWRTHWPGLDPTSEGGELEAAADMARVALEVARSDVASKSPPKPEPAPAPAPAPEPEPKPEFDEGPCTGSFYTVRFGDALTGQASLTARALEQAAREAGDAKGWSQTLVDSRAIRLARDPAIQRAYVKLIEQSAWNTGRTAPLKPGMQLWLPPLWRVPLLDAKRSQRIVLDPQPWSDGSTRLEPPPEANPLQTRGNGREWPIFKFSHHPRTNGARHHAVS